MPANPPHDAVFVSNISSRLPLLCAYAVEFRYGAISACPAVWFRNVGNVVCGSRGTPMLNCA
jgi:hypothetical protein